jgi:hypothetical protein
MATVPLAALLVSSACQPLTHRAACYIAGCFHSSTSCPPRRSLYRLMLSLVDVFPVTQLAASLISLSCPLRRRPNGSSPSPARRATHGMLRSSRSPAVPLSGSFISLSRSPCRPRELSCLLLLRSAARRIAGLSLPRSLRRSPERSFLSLSHHAACQIAHFFRSSTACLLVDCKRQVF